VGDQADVGDTYMFNLILIFGDVLAEDSSLYPKATLGNLEDVECLG